MKECIATAILSIGRIAHQLKEDTKVTPQNADQKLSVCGLRLEHMVATLYKKRPIFNIESVNTDYSSDLPPLFLGIKNNIFVNPPPVDPEDEMDKLFFIAQQQQQSTQNGNRSRTKDEENEFLNEEYLKHKQVHKAL